MAESIHYGGCMCGDIRYRINAEPRNRVMCHCSDCRRVVGAQSVAWITVDVADFWFTQGEPVTFASSKKVERTFCGRCGTSLTYRVKRRRKDIDITTGSLDEPEKFEPTDDYFCRDRLPWIQPSTSKLHD